MNTVDGTNDVPRGRRPDDSPIGEAHAEWLIGGGELGDLIRSTDWGKTPLGPRERWPLSLRTTVNLMVASKFPMALLWKSELLLLYNDGYRIIAADKHPNALGRPTREVWPEVWYINEPILAAVMDRGETFLFENKLFPINRRGYMEDAYFTLSYGPVRNEDGSIGGALVTLQETTERRRMEEDLMRNEQQLQVFLDTMSEGTALNEIVFDEHGEMIDYRIIKVNKSFYTTADFAGKEVVGTVATKLYGMSREAIRAFWEGHRGRTETIYSEMQSPLNERWYFISTSPFVNNQFVTSFIDITERKKAEKKIQQSERFIRGILDSVDECFIVVDRDYRILTANRSYCDQLPVPCDDVIGKNCFAVSHGYAKPCYGEGEDCAVRKVFEDGSPHTVVHKHAGPRGDSLFVETKAFPMKDDAGTVTSVIEVIANITERHLLEDERIKSQKLEAVGRLAGGIAHDFNNLLQGVFGYISLAKMYGRDPRKSMAALEEAENALHLAVRLTNQLLTFSKGGKPVKKTFDIVPVVQDAVRFALSGSHTDYCIQANEGLWMVDADEGQINQVVQNIVLNADQAMPDPGRIEIAVRNVEAPGPDVSKDIARGRYVEVRITDTGTGIPEDYLDRVFDPYFTTKEKGSGLGLATSYSIIRNHHGAIDVVSESGKGATFRIWLPAVTAEAPSVLPAPVPAAPARTGRVLVMDDEQIILNLAGALITALGHDPTLARNGAEVLEKYGKAREDGRPFDIVILDLTVRGGMGGVETIAGLRKLDPDVKAVVSSGYSDDTAVGAYEDHGFKAVLKKPYNVGELKQVINRLLHT